MVVSLIVVGVIVAILFSYHGPKGYQTTLASCPSYKPPEMGFGAGATDVSFITCKGVIVVQQIADANPRYYEILNINNESSKQVIATTKLRNNFTFVNDSLYAVQNHAETNSMSYLKINSGDGTMLSYKNFNEIPIDEQSTFISLENGERTFSERLDNLLD